MKKRFWKNRLFWLGLLAVVFLSLFIFLKVKTGYFDGNNIDEKDLEYWQRDSNGFILNSSEIVLEGNKDVCWLMIHGYTATPKDYEVLSEKVNSKFGDYVYAIRLTGHGRVPSEIKDLTLDNWYLQVSEAFDSMALECSNINVVGFSFGGALATKLSENREIKNTYLIAPYLFPRTSSIKIFDLSSYVNLLADRVIYTHKFQLSRINDPEGLKSYIAYWSFPLQPVKHSQSFLQSVQNNLNLLDNPILIQHSKGDSTADPLASEIIFEKISSSEKELVWFENSNHVILYDYDKEQAVSNILNFEEEHR